MSTTTNNYAEQDNEIQAGRAAIGVVRVDSSAAMQHTAAITANNHNNDAAEDDFVLLYGMDRGELREVCEKQGLITGGSKEQLLKRLGVPLDEWDKLSKLKVIDLKPILKAKGLTVSGNKQDLLVRLGLPLWYGETSVERRARKRREWCKQWRQQWRQQQETAKNRGMELDPADNFVWLYYQHIDNLREICRKRGLNPGGHRASVLKRLGVPLDDWDMFSKLKATQLQTLLKTKGLRVTGDKEDLLKRLGLPLAHIELLERKRQAAKRGESLDPADDLTHWMFNPSCCFRCNPHSIEWAAIMNGVQPAGYIITPNGHVMELYRCEICGSIPCFPNAPIYHEYPYDQRSFFS